MIRRCSYHNSLPSEDDDRDYLTGKLFGEWVQRLWDNANIGDSYLDSEWKQWAIERATGG